MEWVLDPTAWAGLFTLILLEIVLGIDNLIFIAILVDKLPPEFRDRARVLGLSLALVMRLALLSVMSWLITLNAPLFSVFGLEFSGRDLILIVGGMFLLFKGTLELHERIDYQPVRAEGVRAFASFWVIVTQIVILDAVFSIDAVITAVGMVEHLAVMMIAVIVAIIIMIVASKPLTTFVNRHPTVVILCLGFLLMIGFSLLVEGFGVVVPKGYLYAAITFSVLIEVFNQLARRNRRLAEEHRPMRERTAEAVLRMLGKKPISELEMAADERATPDGASLVFGKEERDMVSGVLTLSERNVRSIMTPRNDISWVNMDEPPADIQAQIAREPHSYLPVCKGTLDEVIGLGQAKELVEDLIKYERIRLSRLREPMIVHESIGILQLMEKLKKARGQLVLVADEFGTIAGVVTAIDVFEAIAGEFPDEDEAPDILPVSDNEWLVDGAADLHHLEQRLEIEGLVDDEEEYSTLAGYLLERFGHLPDPGASCTLDWGPYQLLFTVLSLEQRRIASVRIEKHRLEPYDELPADSGDEGEKSGSGSAAGP
ncbi:MAG TPA: TerC family protein [Paenalcaligenes sp.]|nr:TerC family protein [Paenalcaligenes sp.]